MKLRIASFIVSASMAFATHCDAAFLDKEISFSEAEIQAAIDKSKPQQLNYGGLLTVSLIGAAKADFGRAGRAGQGLWPGWISRCSAIRRFRSMWSGRPAFVTTTMPRLSFWKSRWSDSVRSPALRKEAEPEARRAVTALLAGYFRSKPVYVLREDGNAQELAARWLLRSIPHRGQGRVIAVLSPF
jgi:hypothetical protein